MGASKLQTIQVPGRIICPMRLDSLTHANRSRKLAGTGAFTPEEIERDFGCLKELCMIYHVTGEVRDERTHEVIKTGDCALHYGAIIGGVLTDLFVRALDASALAKAVPTALRRWFGDKPKAIPNPEDAA